MIKSLLLVGAGGALGSIARYAVSLLFTHFAICSHWATLAVNIIGSLLIGLAIPMLSNGAALFAVVGFCGGFTTFSTFAHESVQMLQNGNIAAFAGYVAASLVAGFLFAAFGYWLAR